MPRRESDPPDAPTCPYCSKPLGRTGIATDAEPPAHVRCVARTARILKKLSCVMCGKVIIGGPGWCRVPGGDGVAHFDCLERQPGGMPAVQ